MFIYTIYYVYVGHFFCKGHDRRLKKRFAGPNGSRCTQSLDDYSIKQNSTLSNCRGPIDYLS